MPSTRRTPTSPTTPTVPDTGRPRLARHVRRAFDPTRQRHVLLLPETVVALNATGAAVLDLCDGERTVAAIVAELRLRYARVADDEVRGFLGRLAARHCLEVHNG
jgi:pyrroloquinoline quinone biosynthesis protein D